MSSRFADHPMPRAFAVAAHPDDIEFVMSGTLIHLRDAGYEIHYMNLANGCCGSTMTDAATTARIRREEAMAACRKIGAVFHESLVNDLEIFYDHPTIAKLASTVRQVAPQIMLIHAEADYMEDHTNACRLAVTAAFSRGMPNFPVDPPRPSVTQTVTLYHAQPHGNRDSLWRPVRPGLFVDVTAVMDQKLAVLAQHRSQKEWLDASQGLGSYMEAMRDLMREVGTMSGRYEYAEGWRRHSHLGFCGPYDDPLSQALGPLVHSG